MNRTRSVLPRVAVLVVVVAVLAFPGAVAAAPAASLDQRQLQGSAVDQPVQPNVAVPGIFALSLGKGLGIEGGELKLDSAELDLPAINATVSLNGLGFALNKGLTGWNSIKVVQVQPVGDKAFIVSGGQANVHGPSSGYSAEASVNIIIHPDDSHKAEAGLVAGYDGLARKLGVAVQDGSASWQAGPVSFDLRGVNAGGGTLTIDTAQAAIPATGTAVTVDGYKMENGLSDWKSVAVSQNELKLGNVASFTDLQITVPGPASASNTPTDASMHFQVNAGDVAIAQGQLVASHNGATNETSFALSDGSLAVALPGWSLALDGIASAQRGVTIDTIVMKSEATHIEAQLSGVTIGNAGGFSFQQADISYLPKQSASSNSIAGFHMKIAKTDAGYVVTTIAVVPVASSR